MNKKFYIEIKPDFYDELGEDFGNGNLLYIPWGYMEVRDRILYATIYMHSTTYRITL